MIRSNSEPLLASLTSAVFALLVLAPGLSGQYDQNKVVSKINVSNYPPEIQMDYKLFRNKCSECHSVESALKLSMSSVEWTYWVEKMAALPSSHINNQDASRIIAFLNYDEVHRKSKLKAKPSSAASAALNPEAAGRQFFLAHNCNLCHSLHGKGGAVGPPLDNVGNKMTRDQLIERMRGRRAGTVMPPLPANTTDQEINDLVDFLLTLKGAP